VASTDTTVLYLNERHDEIVPGSYIMIDEATNNQAAAQVPPTAGTPLVVNPSTVDEPFYPRIAQVLKAAPEAINSYGMSVTTTRLDLACDWVRPTARQLSDLRPLTVYAQSVDLEVAQVPITDPVPADTAKTKITVDGLYPGLETGHRLVITGTRADLGGASVQAGEPIMIASVSQGYDPGDQPYTTITLAAPLSYSYQRDTVTLWGNVVPAHQGFATTETPTPAGDPANPTFTLTQTQPVLADPSSQDGYASSLVLVIDGRTWTLVDRLDDRTPPRCYITGSDNQGRTTITLSQPLPQPASTVSVTYRFGYGDAGNVQAGQLTQLLTRPLAVATVTNPIAASGGSAADGPDTIRANAPRGLQALGRVVSIDDAADITMKWAGIGKSTAAPGNDGQRDTVTVTVAGTSPAPLQLGSSLLNDLGAALTASGDVVVPISVVPATIMLIVLAAQIQYDPDFTWATVEPAVRAELLDAYGYTQRDIDEDIIISDLIAVIHRVAGVVSCTITSMGLVPSDSSPDQLAKFSPSAPDSGQVEVAGGLSINITDGRIPVTGVAYLSDTVADTLILQGA
jgi:predicted phage baseplate assembly protein